MLILSPKYYNQKIKCNVVAFVLSLHREIKKASNAFRQDRYDGINTLRAALRRCAVVAYFFTISWFRVFN